MKTSKIKTLIAGVFVLFGTGACSDIERFPFDSIEQSQSFLSIRDARTHNNGLYALLRDRASGSYIFATDLQADQVNAGLDYGNRNGNPHRWSTFLSNDGVLSSVWSGYYSGLANVNNQITGLQTITPASDAEQAELNTFIGDAHFARAFYYHQLVRRFAKAYNPATASTDLGVPLVLEYNINDQPARATVAEVYAQILSDIEQAKQLLAGATGSQGAERFTLDVVLALEARVKLFQQDYAGAKAAADQVINSGRYPLLTTEASIKSMWHNDLATEVIFQPVAEAPNELAGTIGNVYLQYNAALDKFAPDFFPSQWVVDFYSDDDFRKDVYFSDELPVFIQGNDYTDLWVINKYPGNPALWTSNVTNYQHTVKLFRIAELYLISAEAGVNIDAAQSLATLNTLRAARGLSPLSGLSGESLLNAVKDERFKELAFEGFRLDDLKRWNEGFTRREPQNLNVIQTGEDYQNLSIGAGNDKFVWGIPVRDETVNPFMVQNPGW